eukprot:Opistho-2@52269
MKHVTIILGVVCIALVASTATAAPHKADSRSISRRLSDSLFQGYRQAVQDFFYYFRSQYDCEQFSSLEQLPLATLPTFQNFQCNRANGSTTPSSSSSAVLPESSAAPSVVASSASFLPQSLIPIASLSDIIFSVEPSASASASAQPAESSSQAPQPSSDEPYNFGACELSKGNAQFLWTLAENTNRDCSDNFAAPPGWTLVTVLNVSQLEIPDAQIPSIAFGAVYSRGLSAITIPTSGIPSASSSSEAESSSASSTQESSTFIEPSSQAIESSIPLLPTLVLPSGSLSEAPPVESVAASQSGDAPVLLYVFRNHRAIQSFAQGDNKDAETASAPFLEGTVLNATLDSYLLIREKVVAIAKAALQLNAETQIVMDGASFGGALAQVAAFDTAKSLGITKPQQMIATTFGSIRTGDIEFARAFNKIVKGSIRVVNSEDLVPTLPPAIWEDFNTGDKKFLEHVQGLIVGFTNNTRDYYTNHIDAYQSFVDRDYPTLWDSCTNTGASTNPSSSSSAVPSATASPSSFVSEPSSSVPLPSSSFIDE